MRRRLVCGVVAMLGVALACAPAGRPAATPTRTDQVAVFEPVGNPEVWGYTPKQIGVPKGTTVTWTNGGKEFHTVTSDDAGRPFDKSMNLGERTTVTFDRPGDFTYHCGVHPQMKGVVHVCDGPCT